MKNKLMTLQEVSDKLNISKNGVVLYCKRNKLMNLLIKQDNCYYFTNETYNKLVRYRQEKLDISIKNSNTSDINYNVSDVNMLLNEKDKIIDLLEKQVKLLENELSEKNKTIDSLMGSNNDLLKIQTMQLALSESKKKKSFFNFLKSKEDIG